MADAKLLPGVPREQAQVQISQHRRVTSGENRYEGSKFRGCVRSQHDSSTFEARLNCGIDGPAVATWSVVDVRTCIII